MYFKPLILALFCSLLSGCTSQQIEEYFFNRRLERDHKAVDLPSLFMEMDPVMLDSIHQSQRIKVNADAVLVDASNDTLYEGEVRFKTRGNASFYNSPFKKPYTITFPYKQHLFDLYPDKSYTLLTNNSLGDRYMSNALAFELARAIGLPTPKAMHIHLYINNRYRGIYQLTNKIAIHPEYLPLHSLSKDNKSLNSIPPQSAPAYNIDEKGIKAYRKGVSLEINPDDITGAYLLDHSYGYSYDKAPSGFYSNHGLPYRIRAPKYASEAEVNYIAEFCNQMEDAVYSRDGYNTQTGKYYTQYINIESFAKYYLIQELLVHHDAGAGSFIMYKNANDTDSLMYAGPVWDFNGFRGDFDFINALYASEKIGTDKNRYGLLYYLCQHPDFYEKVKEIYIQELYPAINELFEHNYFDSLQTLLVLNDTTIASFVRQRSDFLYWLYTADSTDIVQVKIHNTETGMGQDRTYLRTTISFYGNKKDGVKLPAFSYLNLKAPTPENYYLLDLDVALPKDTVFYSNQSMTIKWKNPSKFEVLCRQIKRMMQKIMRPI